jgi:hypothetical protein
VLQQGVGLWWLVLPANIKHVKIIESQKHSSLFLEHPDRQRFVVIMPERGIFITSISISCSTKY